MLVAEQGWGVQCAAGSTVSDALTLCVVTGGYEIHRGDQ